MSGRLIVLDGLDGSGKRTQAALLRDRLELAGERVLLVSFPDYEQPSSALVKEYLGGAYGHAGAVNAYAASSFYAVDRFASYTRFWKKEHEAGYTIIADRYATSNLIHQMCKLPTQDWEGFRRWMEDYEYDRLGLPRPTQVLFLDMGQEVSARLLAERYQGDESQQDIHERDRPYQARCRDCALYAVEHFGWVRVSCSDGRDPYTREAIAQAVYQVVCDQHAHGKSSM